MNIIQVLPGITVGGPSYTVPSLCRALKREGHNVSLHMEAGDFPNMADIDIAGYHYIKFPLLRPLGYSPIMRNRLHKACQSADFIITHSLWMYPNFVTEFARRGTHCKSVVVPRGTLSQYALSLSKWKKKIVCLLGQDAALRKADMLIATCMDEYQDIRQYGIKAPVAIVPNGIDMPTLGATKKSKRVVFLSRIHPKKGVDYLLRAWSKIEKEGIFSDWTLSVVGPECNYSRELESLSFQLGCQRVTFTGAMNGEQKFRYLAESALFVLPTHSENFGIAVAEALACGTPAICTTGAPWEGLETNGCGRWIDLSDDNLYDSMTSLMSLPAEQLEQMGERGKAWMERDFSWDVIAHKLTESFEWLLDPEHKQKPDCVIVD